MRFWGAAATLLYISCFAEPVSAQLAIDRLWVDFEPGATSRADVVIRNESTDRYYITVTAVEIVNPGTTDETRIESGDPEKLGLLVSPNRLVVDPGGLRSIRIVNLNADLAKDRVYRVKVTPQIGAIQATDPGAGNRGVALKLLTAYDLLVTARPAKPDAKLVATRTPAELILRNTGNTNTLLFEGRACSADAKIRNIVPIKVGDTTKEDAQRSLIPDGCIDVGARRMHPGNEWKIPVEEKTGQVIFKERKLSSADPKDVSF